MQTMEELGAIAENNTTLQNEDSARDASSSDDSSQTAELEFGQFLGTPILIEVRKELLGKKTEPLLSIVATTLDPDRMTMNKFKSHSVCSLEHQTSMK